MEMAKGDWEKRDGAAVFVCHGLSQPVIIMMPLTICVDVLESDGHGNTRGQRHEHDHGLKSP
jgi:hypothetical protein